MSSAKPLPSLSRRGFLSLLAATGTVIAVGSGDELLVRVAYASETGVGDPYTLYVVKRWEVPVYLFDVSDPDNLKPVAGVNVRVVSLYNGKTADAVTDGNGIAVVDVRDLSEPDADQGPGEQQYNYCFFGQVVARKDGYRAFETGKMRFTGGEELAVATQPLDGHPYAQMASLDGWDIHYADSTTFIATVANREAHTLIVKTAVSDGNPVRVTVYQENGISLQTESAPDADGVATATLEGAFLSLHADDAGTAFAPEKPVYITASTDAGAGESFTFQTSLIVEQGHFDEASFTTGESLCLDSFIPSFDSALESGPETISVKIPEKIPIIGGISASAPLPFFPVSIDIDPLSYIFIAAKLSASLHKNTDGSSDKRSWAFDTMENATKAASSANEKYRSDYNNLLNSNLASGNKRSSTGCLSGAFGFNPTIEVGLGLFETWDDDLLVWRGDVKGYANLGLTISYTQQFVVGGFPVYVGIGFSLDAMLSLQGGMEMVSRREGLRPQFSRGGQFSFVPKVVLFAEVGIGIAGFASVGVRGSGFLCFTLNALFYPQGKKNPHMVLSAGADLSLSIQAFIYKGSLNICKGRWPYIWSNWPEEMSAFEGLEEPAAGHEVFYVNTPSGLGYSATDPAAIGPLGGLAVDQAFVPVTERELATTVELKAIALNDGTYAYEEARTESATTGRAYNITPLALGENGLRPAETKVYQNIFSDPRQKVFFVDGNLWVARIVPVSYPLGVRTRLTVAKMENGVMGSPRVVNFNFIEADETGKPICFRIDTYDYDFDVLGCDEGIGEGERWDDGGAMRFLLVMGTRPDGDQSSLSGVASHSVSAFLSLSDSLEIKTWHLFFDDFKRTDRDAVLLHPRLIGIPYYRQTVAFALHRVAEPGKTVFDIGYKEYPTDCLFNSDGSFAQTKKGFIDLPENRIYDTSGFHTGTEILTDPKQDIAVVVTNSAIYLKYLCCYTVATSDDEKQAPVVKVFEITRSNSSSIASHMAEVLSTNAGRAYSLHPWPAFRPNGSHAMLLANGRSLTALWRNNIGRPDIQTTTVSLDDNIQLDNFALSADGTLLYYATVRDGKQEDVIDMDGNRTPGDKIRDYRIWASRIVTDESGDFKFMEPFTIAQIDHPADSLTALALKGSYGFLSNSITSLANSTSDMYLYAIPKLIHLTLLGFAPLNRTVCAGEVETFQVSVRNDGNTAIDSFVLVISDGAGEVGRVTVSIPAVQAVLGGQDVPDGNDALLGWYGAAESREFAAGEGIYPGFREVEPVADVPTEAGVLIPGKTRTYRFNWKVPESWHGETPVDVSIDLDSLAASSQPACCEPDEIRMQAKHALELGMAPENLANRVSVELPLATAQYESIDHVPVGDTPYSRTDENGTEIADPGKNPDRDPGEKEPTAGEADKNDEPLAKTGDSLVGTVAAALAVAAGAGATAVTARRAAKKADDE